MVTTNKDNKVSVVLPCLNEEQALGICIKKIKDVFAQYGIDGEIIVADNNSTDRSREIAGKQGVTVVVEERRGYGSAYLCGLKEARGTYIIIGDSDNSYDFGEIPKFLHMLDQGYDFVMGSRFKGEMKKGSMSWSHRYIGNPVLSFLCRLFFKTKLSDIHCGMRAFTRCAYEKMKLRTLGMEFATEMVVSSLTNNLTIAEVPIDYHPREGKSKLKPLYDAWRHIRFMLLYCPVWLYFVPGALGLGIGLIVLLLLARGPLMFLGREWGLHFMVFASVLSILSYQILNLGVFAHSFAINQGFLKPEPLTGFFQRHFSLERGLFLGGLITFIGFAIMFIILAEWLSRNMGALHRIRESIFGMTLIVIGIQTMFFSFFISLLFLERK